MTRQLQASGFAHHSDLGFDFDHDSDEVERVGERTIASTGEIKPVYVFKELPYYGRALQRHVALPKTSRATTKSATARSPTLRCISA